MVIMAALLSSSRKLSRVLNRLSIRGFSLAAKKNDVGIQRGLISSVVRQGNETLGRHHMISFKRNFHPSIVLCEVHVVKTPPFAESVTEGDVRWEKGVGDAVEVDEVVCEIETDKTSIPVPAPSAGVIEELLVEDGDRVEPGYDLFKLNTEGVAAAKPKEAAAAAPPAEPAAATQPPPPTAAAPASAAAGPIPTTPPPVPPIPQQPIASKPASSVKPTPAAAPTQLSGSRTETRVKMNRMRLRIAQRLKDAQNTCAMLTTFNEIDMSNIMQLRSEYKDSFQKKHNIKLGFMSAFLKASAYALEHQPVVNAVIDESEIVYRDYVDISVAVATPKGLVVPVLRNVESMNYADIEKGLVELGEKARTGSLAIEDMDGGTFTISNGGVFGSMFGTPIINPPQSAILGMHGIFERPVAVKGQVVIRPMMYIALTYDHRLIDGREAVTFLKQIKSAVEDPRVMFMDL
ncbi:dihydrolipoyllysine-residue succinyltransferase component of 2-oxoglutarate dehydrogenase complex, mitochondrial-like [Tubulanus polymorphus]|uniref:dihydrolipoyllysine-residue succinyltransferase component of 2-oxoglutarate dehydrogenase complex, mitochondrial-like n=1 Tax=Tubulanus polymorphus TaxID=672921 RepID=UPI003DA3ABF8